MSRIKLLSLHILVAVVAVLAWHVLTTVPIGGHKLLPPFFFSTLLYVANRIVKWFVEGTDRAPPVDHAQPNWCSLFSSVRSPAC